MLKAFVESVHESMITEPCKSCTIKCIEILPSASKLSFDPYLV